MEIDPTDPSFNLIKANIVESFKTCALYTRHTVVRYQKPLLPPHEYVLPLPPALPGSGVCVTVLSTHRSGVSKVDVPLRIFRKRPPGREARPVLEVGLVGSAPARMFGLEGVILIRATNDFASEKGCEYLVLVRETLNTQITCDSRLRNRQCENCDVDIVNLTVGLLSTGKVRPGAEEGRRVMRY